MTVYKLFKDDPTRAYWTIDEPTNADVKKAKSASWFNKLPREQQESIIATLSTGEEYVETPSIELVEEMSKQIDYWNTQANKSYAARKEFVIELLQGKQADAQVELVRKATKLTAANFLKLIKHPDTGEVAKGVQPSTIAYLEGLVAEGKKKFQARTKASKKS